MAQHVISYEVNKKICEAFGCFSKAKAEIEVKVGQKGTISLSLCSNCVDKFVENQDCYYYKTEEKKRSE